MHQEIIKLDNNHNLFFKDQTKFQFLYQYLKRENNQIIKILPVQKFMVIKNLIMIKNHLHFKIKKIMIL